MKNEQWKDITNLLNSIVIQVEGRVLSRNFVAPCMGTHVVQTPDLDMFGVS